MEGYISFYVGYYIAFPIHKECSAKDAKSYIICGNNLATSGFGANLHTRNLLLVHNFQIFSKNPPKSINILTKLSDISYRINVFTNA